MKLRLTLKVKVKSLTYNKVLFKIKDPDTATVKDVVKDIEKRFKLKKGSVFLADEEGYQILDDF
jgi:hypothetical protein